MKFNVTEELIKNPLLPGSVQATKLNDEEKETIMNKYSNFNYGDDLSNHQEDEWYVLHEPNMAAKNKASVYIKHPDGGFQLFNIELSALDDVVKSEVIEEKLSEPFKVIKTDKTITLGSFTYTKLTEAQKDTLIELLSNDSPITIKCGTIQRNDDGDFQYEDDPFITYINKEKLKNFTWYLKVVDDDTIILLIAKDDSTMMYYYYSVRDIVAYEDLIAPEEILENLEFNKKPDMLMVNTTKYVKLNNEQKNKLYNLSKNFVEFTGYTRYKQHGKYYYNEGSDPALIHMFNEDLLDYDWYFNNSGLFRLLIDVGEAYIYYGIILNKQDQLDFINELESEELVEDLSDDDGVKLFSDDGILLYHYNDDRLIYYENKAQAVRCEPNKVDSIIDLFDRHLPEIYYWRHFINSEDIYYNNDNGFHRKEYLRTFILPEDKLYLAANPEGDYTTLHLFIVREVSKRDIFIYLFYIVVTSETYDNLETYIEVIGEELREGIDNIQDKYPELNKAAEEVRDLDKVKRFGITYANENKDEARFSLETTAYGTEELNKLADEVIDIFNKYNLHIERTGCQYNYGSLYFKGDCTPTEVIGEELDDDVIVIRSNRMKDTSQPVFLTDEEKEDLLSLFVVGLNDEGPIRWNLDRRDLMSETPELTAYELVNSIDNDWFYYPGRPTITVVTKPGFSERIFLTSKAFNQYINDNSTEIIEGLSDTIELTTVQGNQAVETLKQGKTYYADYNNLSYKGYEEQYKNLAKLLGIKHCPIFCAPNDDEQSIDASGDIRNGRVKLTLNVPRDEAHLTDYYSWSDYLYYSDGNEYDKYFKFDAKQAMDNIDKYVLVGEADTPQYIIDRIEPEWVINMEEPLKENVSNPTVFDYNDELNSYSIKADDDELDILYRGGSNKFPALSQEGINNLIDYLKNDYNETNADELIIREFKNNRLHNITKYNDKLSILPAVIHQADNVYAKPYMNLHNTNCTKIMALKKNGSYVVIYEILLADALEGLDNASNTEIVEEMEQPIELFDDRHRNAFTVYNDKVIEKGRNNEYPFVLVTPEQREILINYFKDEYEGETITDDIGTYTYNSEGEEVNFYRTVEVNLMAPTLIKDSDRVYFWYGRHYCSILCFNTKGNKYIVSIIGIFDDNYEIAELLNGTEIIENVLEEDTERIDEDMNGFFKHQYPALYNATEEVRDLYKVKQFIFLYINGSEDNARATLVANTKDPEELAEIEQQVVDIFDKNGLTIEKTGGSSDYGTIFFSSECSPVEIIGEELITEDIAAVQKNFPNIPEDKFMKLIKLDPTYKENSNSVGKYGKWILNLYNKKNLKDEDFYKVPDYLKSFEAKRSLFTNKDIGQFKSLPDLAKALDEVGEVQLTQSQQQRQNRRNAKQVELGDEASLVFENNEWEVWVPHTYAASCKLGAGSHWCTASTSNDAYYNQYKEEYGGEYYIVLNKQDPEEKYQFHAESNQYMDIYDRPIDVAEFLEDKPDMRAFFLRAWNIPEDLMEDGTYIMNNKTIPAIVQPYVKKLYIDDSVTNIETDETKGMTLPKLEYIKFPDTFSFLGDDIFYSTYKNDKAETIVDIPDSMLFESDNSLVVNKPKYNIRPTEKGLEKREVELTKEDIEVILEANNGNVSGNALIGILTDPQEYFFDVLDSFGSFDYYNLSYIDADNRRKLERFGLDSEDLENSLKELAMTDESSDTYDGIVSAINNASFDGYVVGTADEAYKDVIAGLEEAIAGDFTMDAELSGKTNVSLAEIQHDELEIMNRTDFVVEGDWLSDYIRTTASALININEPYYGWDGFDEDVFNDSLSDRLDELEDYLNRDQIKLF